MSIEPKAKRQPVDWEAVGEKISSLEIAEQVATVGFLPKSIRLKEAILDGKDVWAVDCDLLDIVRPVRNLNRLSGETKACALFDYLMMGGSLGEFESPAITFEREFSVNGMRIDRLIRHKDGSVTAVEIKPRGVMRDMSHGIGQSLLYAAALVTSGHDLVRPALFIPGPKIELLAEAARIGGVQYLYMDCSIASIELVMDLLKWVEESSGH